MKKLSLLFLLLVTVCSCSEELLTGSSSQVELVSTNAVFNFDSIKSQGNWKTSSIQQKFDACQIPDSILPSLSTDQLVELCASHPLNSLCYAYDNPMVGAKYIMHRFNGFEELQKRKDAAEKLINFYDSVNFSTITSSPYPMTLKYKDKFYSSSNISFIEFVLASDEIPDLYKRYSERLEEVSYNKFEQKLKLVDIYGILNLNNSLMIQSKIALKSNKLSSKEERETIQEFYNNYGHGTDISKVSNILFNQH